MKKVLLMLAMILPMITFTACSDDEDYSQYESKFIGSWEEDRTGYEVFNIVFNADKTGERWAEDNGEIDEFGKSSFVWSATESELTITSVEEGKYTLIYEFKDDKLYTSSDGETIIYHKK